MRSCDAQHLRSALIYCEEGREKFDITPELHSSSGKPFLFTCQQHYPLEQHCGIATELCALRERGGGGGGGGETFAKPSRSQRRKGNLTKTASLCVSSQTSVNMSDFPPRLFVKQKFQRGDYGLLSFVICNSRCIVFVEPWRRRSQCPT